MTTAKSMIRLAGIAGFAFTAVEAVSYPPLRNDTFIQDYSRNPTGAGILRPPTNVLDIQGHYNQVLDENCYDYAVATNGVHINPDRCQNAQKSTYQNEVFIFQECLKVTIMGNTTGDGVNWNPSAVHHQVGDNGARGMLPSTTGTSGYETRDVTSTGQPAVWLAMTRDPVQEEQDEFADKGTIVGGVLVFYTLSPASNLEGVGPDWLTRRFNLDLGNGTTRFVQSWYYNSTLAYNQYFEKLDDIEGCVAYSQDSEVCSAMMYDDEPESWKPACNVDLDYTCCNASNNHHCEVGAMQAADQEAYDNCLAFTEEDASSQSK